MSSGEEYDVEEILEQRKRKGGLEYLVRWQGFSELYDSWEPASSLTNCAGAIKAFLSKKRSRSKSRSRSRGRASKSKSRSTSRGRKKTGDTRSRTRSRSRSAARKTTQSSSKTTTTTSSKSTSKAVAKREASPVKEQIRGRSRSNTRSKAVEVKASASKSEAVSEKVSSSHQGGILEKKTEVVTKTVETVQATPVRQQMETMTTRSRLAVRQVENDQRPAPTKSSSTKEEKETWIWWFADHAVLILFIIISIIALSFTIESLSGVRDKLTPDFGVLRQRLGESYQHSVDAVSHVVNMVVEILPTWGDKSSGTEPPTPKTSKGTA